MTEIVVQQRTEEWFELRQCVLITASQFADAAGLGRGKAADFLSSLVCGDATGDVTGSGDAQHDAPGARPQQVETLNVYAQHGIDMEPVIREAYELLTGASVHDSGFWVPNKDHDMFNMIGATPDGKVMERQAGKVVDGRPGGKVMQLRSGSGGKVVEDRPDVLTCVGLVEFKAPVYQLGTQNADPKTGVSRAHMAQIQGQMAVCKKPWCDYMVVCMASRELVLKRVYFSTIYWQALSLRLKVFCRALQDCRRLKSESKLYTVRWSEKLPAAFSTPLGAEKGIKVVDLIERNANKEYRYKFSKRKMWMSFNFLVGLRDA